MDSHSAVSWPLPRWMNYSHRIFPQHRLITSRFSGPTGLREVIRGSEQLWSDPDYNKHFQGITDLSACEVQAKPKDVPALIEFLRNSQCSQGRWAAIFSEPQGIALATLFEFSNALSSRFKVCSTWEGASEFLRLDPPSPAFQIAMAQRQIQ